MSIVRGNFQQRHFSCIEQQHSSTVNGSRTTALCYLLNCATLSLSGRLEHKLVIKRSIPPCFANRVINSTTGHLNTQKKSQKARRCQREEISTQGPKGLVTLDGKSSCPTRSVAKIVHRVDQALFGSCTTYFGYQYPIFLSLKKRSSKEHGVLRRRNPLQIMCTNV